MSDVSLVLFGGFEALLLPSRTPLKLGTKKAQALLAYCALRPGSHLRQALATLLWGDSSDDRARNSLRQTLFVLRTGLSDSMSPLFRIEADSVSTNPLALDVDVRAFERLAAEGTAQALERAAALYRGDLLDGLVVESEVFEQWLMHERERLRDLAIEVLAKLLRLQSVNGRPDAAIHTARRLLALDPLQEAVHRALMHLFARTGRRESALHQYEVCASVLERELCLEPELDTQRLRQTIASGYAFGSVGLPWHIEIGERDENMARSAPPPTMDLEQAMLPHGNGRAADGAAGIAARQALIVQARSEQERARRLRADQIETSAMLRRTVEEHRHALATLRRLGAQAG